MTDEPPAEISAEQEEPSDRSDLALKWINEINAAQKAQKKWLERADKVEKIYNDERDLSSSRQKRMNMLWSNVETLRPAVYMQTPKARAVRRYRDRDPVARLASMLLERCIQASCELYDFDNAMDQTVRDRLVVGRGQAWVFYEAEIVEETLAYESVTCEYVPWQDFLHSVARQWSEVRWVARRFYKSRRQLKAWAKQSGLKFKPSQINLDFSVEGDKSDEGLKDERNKAVIWEVWDKESRQVLYVAPGSNENAILGVKPPPVSFRDFWPCPRPILATHTAKSLIPTPDYALYQDQAEQLNKIEARISVLQSALKVVGVYASESAELGRMLEGTDNDMIPVANWAMFSEGGGAKGRIEWFPVEQVATVLQGLYEMREQAKQTLYEVSGIGDILRGATDPDETATAQGIKAKWGGLRVRRIQKDVQRFAADVMRLKAEVIAEQFRFPSILSMAGVDEDLLGKYVPMPQVPPMPQMPPEQVQQLQRMAQQQAIGQFLKQVEALLRDDVSRSFRIDVETDSTLEPDAQEEKQIAVEFMTAMTGFMKEAAPMAMQGPEAAKLVGELLLFGVRRFDKVDQLEQVIEQAVEAAGKPREAPPDPEMQKVQIEAERGKQELAIKGQEVATRAKLDEQKLILEGQKVKVDATLRAAELRMKKDEIGLKAREIDQKGMIEGAKLEDGKEARKEEGARAEKSETRKERLERYKAMTPEQRADAEAKWSGRATEGEGVQQTLQQLLAEMQRPKRVERTANGIVVSPE